MALPNPGMSFTPFDILTAEEMNNLVENIESLAAGTGFTAGSIPSTAMTDSGSLEKYRSELVNPFIVSGMVWSALAGLNAAMTSGVAYLGNGLRVAVSSVATRAFTASRDTYVYIDSAGVLQYSVVLNNAQTPTLPDGASWVYRVITNGSTVTSVVDMRGLLGAWIPFIPAFTNLTLGNGTLAAFYRVIGKTVHLRVTVTFGTTTSISGQVTFTPPVPYASTYNQRTAIGHTAIEDAGVGSYAGPLRINDSASNLLQPGVWTTGSTYAGFSNFSSTVPITWGNLDQLMMTGSYERS